MSARTERLAAAGLIALLSLPATGPLRAECKLAKLLEIPVTMVGLRPTVVAQINGTDTTFIVDSGAFFSNLSPAKAAELELRLGPAPPNLIVHGIGGNTDVSIAHVRELTLLNLKWRDVEFLVGGSEPGNGISGLLGQNLLRMADAEYDLAHGSIRLMRPHGCDKAALAYWAEPSQPYSQMQIDWATPTEPYTTGTALLNGARIRVMFDTGASPSFVSIRAAERAGIKLDQPGVTPAGLSHGIGSRPIRTWIAPFASFTIGNEEVRNTRLRIGELSIPDVDMLIGADFFLSHRIYVASSQRKLYFTYNGGPVFNLNKSPLGAAPSEEPAQAADEPGKPEGTEDPNEPRDAAGFSRRGTAFAARRDFEHAIADLTRACELDPSQPSYFYERGIARLHNSQPQLAAADFDQALTIKPDDIPSRIMRAELRMTMTGIPGSGRAGAIADLDAADRAASKQADVRFELGRLYLGTGQFDAAVAQYDLWTLAHRDDARMADALSARSWARTLAGKDFAKAVADSNAALRLRPHEPRFLNRRAFAHLRAGEIDKAIADWNAVLANNPQNPFALYGRGVAKVRAGQTSDGQADISAATALQPHIAEFAIKEGLAP